MNTNSANNTIMISADTALREIVHPASPVPRFRQSALQGVGHKQPHSAQGAPQPQRGTKLGTLNTPRSTPASVPISGLTATPADKLSPAELQIAAKCQAHRDKSHHRPNADINFPGIIISVIAQAAIPMVAASRSSSSGYSMR